MPSTAFAVDEGADQDKGRLHGGLPGPSLGNAPFLQGGLFLIGSAPARSGDDAGGVDRPAGHGRIPFALQPGIEPGERVLNRIGARELFAQQPDRPGVGDRVLQAEPQKAHERQPVPDWNSVASSDSV